MADLVEVSGKAPIVAPYGCDLDYGSARNELRQRPAHVLAFGSVYYHKRLDLVIDAVGELVARGQPTQLRIIGPILDADLSRLLVQQSQRVLGENVLEGSVPRDDRDEVLDWSDVVMFGGAFESFGQVFVESMRRGAVVVAPRSPIVEELCGRAAVTYSDDDPASAASALEHALKHLNHYSLGGLARSNDFTWRRHVEQTLIAIRIAAGHDESGGSQ